MILSHKLSATSLGKSKIKIRQRYQEAVTNETVKIQKIAGRRMRTTAIGDIGSQYGHKAGGCPSHWQW